MYEQNTVNQLSIFERRKSIKLLYYTCHALIHISNMSVDVVSKKIQNSINGNNVFEMNKLKVKEMQYTLEYTARVILSV